MGVHCSFPCWHAHSSDAVVLFSYTERRAVSTAVVPEIGQQEQTELAKHKAEWPPADQWLTNRMSDADHSRMKMLGNIVVPQQAQLAMRILGSAHMS